VVLLFGLRFYILFSPQLHYPLNFFLLNSIMLKKSRFIIPLLALIGAIVAEFFGTPIVGMGFRISTEVGRMNVDMVWAEIAVAAVAGSLFYGAVALVERIVTFWHPSVRGGQA